MEGNSCLSKPILETCVFAKGRVNFHHSNIAGTGWVLPESDVEMAQQVSAENQLLVLSRLTRNEEMQGPGELKGGWQDSAVKSRAVPILEGCRWTDWNH